MDSKIALQTEVGKHGHVNASINFNAIHPVVFRGRHDEQFHIFIKKFELYCEFGNTEGRYKLTLFRLLLEDLAYNFYDTLDNSVQSDFDQLKAAFVEHFQSDPALINSDKLDSMTVKSDEHIEDYITKVLRMCDSMQMDDEAKVRALQRGLTPSMKAQVLMTCPSDVATTINRMRAIYYLDSIKMEARTTHDEATTDDVMRRLDDLSNRLITIGLGYDKLEAKSSVYLSSHQRGTGDNYYKPRDRCSYSTRCIQRPVFPREVYRHHTSVPNRSNRNFGTSSRLSNRFGAPSCTIMHDKIQRVNRRHSPRIQYHGPCRYRLEPAMTDDRRGVDMWDHRRYGNGNGNGNADMNNGAWDEQYHEADHNNYVHWRRGPNGDANNQSRCQLFKKKSPVSQNNEDMNARITYIQRYVPDTNNIGDQNTLINKVNKQYVNSVTIDTGNCTDNKVKNSNTLQSKVNVITLKENKININISGRVSPALIDSGAAICCIRKQFLESFPVCIKKNVMSSDIDRYTSR